MDTRCEQPWHDERQRRQQVQRPLNPTEQAVLAREVAADKHVDGSGWYNEQMREVFLAGWDAALAWTEKREISNGFTRTSD